MTRRLVRSLIAISLVVFNLMASEQHGVVTFGGLPVPGATVTATQGDKKRAVTDANGAYSFPDLADGIWSIQVEMLGFSPMKDEMTAGSRPATWELKMLPLDQIHAEAQLAAPPKPVATGGAPAERKKRSPNRRSAKQNRRGMSWPNGPPMAF